MKLELTRAETDRLADQMVLVGSAEAALMEAEKGFTRAREIAIDAGAQLRSSLVTILQLRGLDPGEWRARWDSETEQVIVEKLAPNLIRLGK